MNRWVCLVRAATASAEIKTIPLPFPVRHNGGPIEGWIVELDRRGAELWGRFADAKECAPREEQFLLADKLIAAGDPSRATGEDLQRILDLMALDTTGAAVDEPKAEMLLGATLTTDAQIIVSNQGAPLADEQIGSLLDGFRPRPDVSFAVRDDRARMVRNEPERRTEIYCSTEEAEVVRRHHAAVFGADRVKVEPGRVLILDEPDLSLTLTEQMLLAQGRGDDDEPGDSFLERFSALPSHEGDYVALLNENNPEGAVGLFSANGVPRVVMPRDAYEKFVAEFGPREPPSVLVLDAPRAKDNGVYDVGEGGSLSRPWFSADEIAEMREPRLPVPGEPNPQIVVGVDPAGGSSITMAVYADGMQEIRAMDLRPCQANPRRIDAILPAAEVENGVIAARHLYPNAFVNEHLETDERIESLMIRLDRLAKTVPRLAPTVEALLWRAANSDDTFGDLAVGLRRIQAGEEIVNGEWVRGSLGVTSPDEVRKVFEALAHQAKTGAAELRELAEKHEEIDGKVCLRREDPAPVRPNRHERRKQASIARRAKR